MKRLSKKTKRGLKHDTFDIQDDTLLKVIKKLPLLMLTCLTLLTAALFINWWVFDIIASYLPLAMIILIGGFLVLGSLYIRFVVRDGWNACRRSINGFDRYALAILGGLSIYILVFSLSLVPRVEQADGAENFQLKITTFNKLLDNNHSEKIVDHLRIVGPDIIALQEVRSSEVDLIRDSLGMKYSIVTDCNCSAGDTEIGLISKYPIGDITTIEDENLGIVAANVIINQDHQVRIFAVHVPPPVSQEAYDIRNKALGALPAVVDNFSESPIILGDFNTSIYSPHFRELARNLEDRELVHVSTRSWPNCSWYLYGDALCVRIDHIFVPSQYKLLEQIISDDIGSDHRAVTAILDIY